MTEPVTPSTRESLTSTLRTALGPALRDIAIAVVVAGGLYALSTYLIRLHVPYVLFLVVVLAVVAGRHVTSAVAPPPVLEHPVRETELRAFGLPDRPFADVRRWEERLSLVQGDPTYFDRSVRPAIAAAVDERLRLSHALNRTDNPDRAKEILGPTLWEFLHQDDDQGARSRRSPSPAELALIVTEMEELWERRH